MWGYRGLAPDVKPSSREYPAMGALLLKPRPFFAVALAVGHALGILSYAYCCCWSRGVTYALYVSHIRAMKNGCFFL